MTDYRKIEAFKKKQQEREKERAKFRRDAVERQKNRNAEKDKETGYTT